MIHIGNCSGTGTLGIFISMRQEQVHYIGYFVMFYVCL